MKTSYELERISQLEQCLREHFAMEYEYHRQIKAFYRESDHRKELKRLRDMEMKAADDADAAHVQMTHLKFNELRENLQRHWRTLRELAVENIEDAVQAAYVHENTIGITKRDFRDDEFAKNQEKLMAIKEKMEKRDE